MFYKIIASLIISTQIFFATSNIDAQITEKTAQMNELKAEITEAQKTVGLAETMDYVEKIGLVEQLQAQIEDLEKKKESLKGA